MKGKLELLMMCAAIWPLGLNAQEPADIVEALKNVKCYQSDARFTVSMPQLSEDVVYELKLTSRDSGGDPLLLCDYLIQWELTGRAEPVSGFSAYFDGHHYRYSGERLQEYHMDWDSIPFMPKQLSGLKADGVQRSAQFANIIPQIVGDDLSRILSDDRYKVTFHPDTVISGLHYAVIEADMIINGEVTQESEYVFDPKNKMPVRIQLENNPGSLSEQTVQINYENSTADDQCEPITEERLMAIYPQVFENFRENNFRIENLPGTKLPGFSLPTASGERYTRMAGDPFVVPTIIALIEPGTAFNADLVNDVRGAIDELPFEAGVIWAVATTNIDSAEEIVPSLRKGEHLLINARGLARDCGATALPVLIVADKKGIVTQVELGYNNDLRSVVIQKMALIQ